jgi:hypothetical protein
MIVFFIFQSSFSLEQKAGAATEIWSVTVSVPHHTRRRWRLRSRSRHVSHAKQRTLNFKGHSRADAPANGERPCSVGEGNAGRLFQRLG